MILKALLRMLIVGFTARFFHQMNIVNHNIMRDGFGHIINGQAGNANRGQCFHLYPSFMGDFDGSGYGNALVRIVIFKAQTNLI